MPVRIVEGQKPYTAGPGIDIDANKVISLLLREENNLIYINDNDEAYVDLQLQSGLTPNSDFPVGVTVGKVLQSDGWTKSGLVLNRKTTSGDYARWIYAADGTLYLDPGTGAWKQVYYSSDVDTLISNLNAKVENYYQELSTRIDNISTPDAVSITITAINNGVATGVISDGELSDGSVVEFVLDTGVSPANVSQIDIDGETYYFNPERTAENNMAGIFKVATGDNVFFMFDGDSSGGTQVQSNWSEADASDPSYIRNKPTIPSVINNLTSTSTTDALSAAQGKALNDKIEDLSGLGKFLSLWNASTGQPISFPLDIPYTYTTGDYFLVEVVSSATPVVNYKPNGSSYTGTASSTTESDELEVGDVYIYDGTTWLLQSNHGKTVAFANIAGQPSDNTALDNALDAKQDNLVSGTNIKTVNSNSLLGSGDVAISEFSPSNSGSTGQVLKKTSTGYNWANETRQVSDTAYGSSWDGVTGTAPSKNAVYDKLNAMDTTIAGKQATLSAGTGISISSNTVTNTGVTSFNGSTGAVTYTAPVTSVNGQTGAVTVAEFKATNGGVKIFDMPSVNGDMSAIVEWLTGGGDVILRTISSNVETYYTVIEWDGTNRTIKAENSSGSTVVVYTVTYSSAGVCTAVTNQSYSGGEVNVSTQANNILTSGMKIWAGTQANYKALSSYDNNTVYLTIE